jgi:hypothetical protein
MDDASAKDSINRVLYERAHQKGNHHGLDNPDSHGNLHWAGDQRLSASRVLIAGPLF